MRKYPSAKELGKKTKPGRYAVGHGAYLQVSKWGTRSWILRYVRDGKARHLGLGSCTYVTLAEAREKAHAARRAMVLDDTDPLMAKRQAKRGRLLASERDKSFKQCALDYIAAHEAGWRGDHSRQQWVKSLEKHVFPRIGGLPVAGIDVAAVLSVLDPIARAIPETASRVRNRIALVLDWASARDLRSHDNPAKRTNLLPKRKQQVQHLAAMPYVQVPAFLAELRLRPEISARALEFAILTAARPSEALGARWSEIDGNVWTAPADRMKSGRAHRVPLAPRVVELLASMPREGEFIFGEVNISQAGRLDTYSAASCLYPSEVSECLDALTSLTSLSRKAWVSRTSFSEDSNTDGRHSVNPDAHSLIEGRPWRNSMLAASDSDNTRASSRVPARPVLAARIRCVLRPSPNPADANDPGSWIICFRTGIRVAVEIARPAVTDDSFSSGPSPPAPAMWTFELTSNTANTGTSQPSITGNSIRFSIRSLAYDAIRGDE